MLRPRNNRSALELFSGFDATIRHYLIDRPRAQWHVLRGKFEHLPETNFKLGCEFADRGQWFDASLRFRFVVYLDPAFTQAHYNLGCCYLQMGKQHHAYDAFVKTLKLDPAHREARFMLSGLAPNSMPPDARPKTMPRDMVVGFFTQLAPGYDQLAETNLYDGPRIVVEASKPYLAATRDLHLIDLGCGTGLIAKPWRTHCREIFGVDITPAMVTASQVARAGDNPAYDRVLEEDINRIAPGTFMPSSADVVLCIDTAQFLGDLAPLCALAAATLKPGGLFVVTTEPFAAPHGFGVNPETGRFGHRTESVQSVAQAAGLELRKDGRVPLYASMHNHLFVFAKRAA